MRWMRGRLFVCNWGVFELLWVVKASVGGASFGMVLRWHRASAIKNYYYNRYQIKLNADAYGSQWGVNYSEAFEVVLRA